MMLLLCVLCVSLVVGAVVGQSTPPSPCSVVFQYEFDNGQWWGHVVVPFPRDVTEVKVGVSLFITALVPPGSRGGLRLKDDINSLWQRPSHIDYTLVFPLQSPLPSIDKITVNNQIICQGPPVSSRILTTAAYSHTLNLTPQQGNRPNAQPGNRNNFDSRPPGRQWSNIPAVPQNGGYSPKDDAEMVDVNINVANQPPPPYNQGQPRGGSGVGHTPGRGSNQQMNPMSSNTDGYQRDRPSNVGAAQPHAPRKPEGDGTADIQMEPQRVVVQPGDDVTLLVRAGFPLTHCHFYLPGPNRPRVNLSNGPRSATTDEYKYYGSGLENGDCGIELKQVDDRMDGVVECKIKKKGARGFLSYDSTVRVTEAMEVDLPAFEINPRQETVNFGDEITITCDADRELEFCHFYLPGSKELNFDLGPESEKTDEYRYYGTGLEYGECGVTLKVKSKLSGFIICKLGSWPDDVNGNWDMDVMRITTNGSRLQPRILKPKQQGSQIPSGVLKPIKQEVTCGVPAIHQSLIFNGMPTERGEWPWLAALYLEKNMKFICGSTLINRKHAITAGHCIKPPPKGKQFMKEQLIISFGKYDLSKWAERGVQNREIEKIILHPQYDHLTLAADVAVLVINVAVEYTNLIRPICMWDMDPSLDNVVKENATVVGWGREEKENDLSDKPLLAVVPIVSQEECVNSNEVFSLYVTKGTLCGGFRNGTGPCDGDSGGGLVLPRTRNMNTQWFLRGIVSFSIQGNKLICNLNQYNIYTDVAQYLEWIKQIMTIS